MDGLHLFWEGTTWRDLIPGEQWGRCLHSARYCQNDPFKTLASRWQGPVMSRAAGRPKATEWRRLRFIQRKIYSARWVTGGRFFPPPLGAAPPAENGRFPRNRRGETYGRREVWFPPPPESRWISPEPRRARLRQACRSFVPAPRRRVKNEISGDAAD